MQICLRTYTNLRITSQAQLAFIRGKLLALAKRMRGVSVRAFETPADQTLSFGVISAGANVRPEYSRRGV